MQIDKNVEIKLKHQVPPGGEAIGAGGSSGPSVDLSTAMTGEALQPILSQEGFLDKVCPTCRMISMLSPSGIAMASYI